MIRMTIMISDDDNADDNAADDEDIDISVD